MDTAAYEHGIRLFNQGAFFDAHEVLEDAWRSSSGPEKKFLQGLIQVAVALHHHSTGNLAGARSLLARARRNLADYPEVFAGIHLGELRPSLDSWSSALARDAAVPPLPQLKRAA